MSEEQRIVKRIPFVEDITILSPQKISGQSVDIGAGGIGIEVPVGLQPGTSVELVILEGHAITFGTVRWARPVENGFRLGIMFREEDWNIIELIMALRSQEG